jgi:hypothetical protein
MEISNCPKCGSTEERVLKEKGPHKGEYCGACGHFYRWIPKGIEEFVWPVGSKHRGKLILEILKIDRPYLEWAAASISIPNLCKKAQEALSYSTPTQPTPKPKLVLTRKPTGSTRDTTNTDDSPPPWDV